MSAGIPLQPLEPDHRDPSRAPYSVNFRSCVRWEIDDIEDDPARPGRVTVDGGKETRWGISKKGNPDLDIHNLAREDAVRRYHENYWIPIRADELPYELALVTFDFYIQNQSEAVPELQKLLRVEADGVVGPDTIAASKHRAKEKALRFISNRLGWYEALVDRQPHHAVSIKGWRWRMAKLACAIGECQP